MRTGAEIVAAICEQLHLHHEMTSPEFTFILPSYLRPANMQRQLHDIAAARIGDKRVILTNNNPEIDIFRYLEPVQPAWVHVVQQPRRRLSSFRFEIAREVASPYILSLDDDLFLSPDQIVALAHAVVKNPRAPHSVWGQNIVINGDGSEDFVMVRHINCQVDILNRAYALTRMHLARFFEILDALGIPGVDELGPADDILISHCGTERPWCHELGSFQDCPTMDTPGIAAWKEDIFHPHRVNFLQKLQRLGLRHKGN